MFLTEFETIIGTKSSLSRAYIYNDCMEGDEFCLKVATQDESVFQGAALTQGLNLAAMGGQQALLSYAMKDTLRQQFEEMQS